mmetsp:Transcript_1773/g.3263  ORF Transcript_1773/g.3263 Transcript_1773/m.3263 type:complete len:106 (-) Transcript_1773:159-476(-)
MAVVLGNIHIGEGAKIAACSVVVKAVPPGVTVAGCPATIVGQGKLQTSKSAGKTERRTNQEALMATLVPLCDNLVCVRENCDVHGSGDVPSLQYLRRSKQLTSKL